MGEPHTATVIGDALIDEVQHPDEVERFVGGAALNLATGLQALGISTTLVSPVGDDEGGRLVQQHLDARGVALDKLQAPLGTGIARSDRTHGEPTYTFNPAMLSRTYAFGDAESALVRSTDITVVNSYPVDRDDQTEELEYLLAEAIGFTAYDPNPRPTMIGSHGEFLRGFESIASRVSLVKISSEDAAWMFGSSLDAAIEQTLAFGAGMVLATAGAGGAAIVTADGIGIARPIVDLPGPIVDTMGAGDATLASLLHRISLHGTDLTAEQWGEHLDFAMEVAARTVRSVGADIQLP